MLYIDCQQFLFNLFDKNCIIRITSFTKASRRILCQRLEKLFTNIEKSTI